MQDRKKKMLNLYVRFHGQVCRHIKRNGVAPSPFGEIGIYIRRRELLQCCDAR